MKINEQLKKVLWISLILVWVFAALNTELTPIQIARGIPRGWDYLTRVFPPDLSILPRLWPAVLETYTIAITAMGLAVSFALPLSFLGAFNISPHPFIYQATRTLFNFCRGFPPIFVALLLVSMIGLGPLPAVLALTIHNIGTLGKYFSEGTEQAELTEVAEAMAIDGANMFQIIIYGFIPMLRALYTGYILYYFEYSVRASTYMGLVGAGGLGIFLGEAVSLFRYHQVGTIVLVLATMVMVNDLASAQVRKRMLV